MSHKLLYKEVYVPRQKHPTLFNVPDAPEPQWETCSCPSPSHSAELSFYFLLFSEVFIILRFVPVFCFSSSLFHTLTSAICYAPSVFFSWTLGGSFWLSFYLLHEGRDSFICLSLFPEPDAQSLAYRRCFWKCLLSYWMWFSDHPPSFLLYWSPLGFLHQVTCRHLFFSCTQTLA